MNTTVLAFQVDADAAIELTRNMYHADFPTTWTRETTQNSKDAQATLLKISNTYDNNDHTTTLIAEDDGHGMTSDVIYNKFLALGGSYKRSDEKGEYLAVGGFGIAKTIVLGGNVKKVSPSGNIVSWFVETTCIEDGELTTYYFDSAMMGKTSLKKLEPTNEKTGTKITIFRKGYCADSYFTETIENSNVMKILYNGTELRQLRRMRGQDISHLFPEETDTSWLKVFYKKDVLSHQYNTVIFRVKGVYQFDQYESDIPGALVIEITSKNKPTDEEYPLTPNREQIKDAFGYKKIIRRITSYFKVREEKKEREDFIFDIFENPYFNEDIYSRFYNETSSNSNILKSPDDEEILLSDEKKLEDVIEQDIEELDKETSNKERKRLEKYEKERKALEQQRMKAVEAEKMLGDILDDIKKDEETKISTYTSIFSPKIQSITIRREKKVNSRIDLNNPKNTRVLLTSKIFIDLIFELTKESNIIHFYNYNIGWNLIKDSKRVELIERDSNNFLLLNPISLNVSDVRLFTNNVLQRLVFEIMSKSYYGSTLNDKYFEVMERFINPNIRVFERIAKRIIRN